ncbi:MAG: MarR family transcriptional regulator [Promethearchaeota archaeon]|nr:MAG: MarR family transcriptional regulator [Candidatus Lokiarchaeota archaeon]
MSMSNRRTFRNTHIFEGKIREYELQLINFALAIGERRGQSPIITNLLTYLLIHEQLTQKQLKQLTGFSIGSISTHLTAMMSMGFIDKRFIPGTHTNTYFLKIDLGPNLSNLKKMSLSYLNQAREFLKSKREDLNKIIDKKKEGLETILNRFNEIEVVLQIYAKLVEMLINVDDIKDFDYDLKYHKDPYYTTEFDPEIKIIEDDLVEFFTYTPMFFGKQELFSEVFAYFITRKKLSQKNLRKLTGLSAGKISQEINNLLELGIIRIVEKSEKGELIYQMDSVSLSFLKISYNILSEYIVWKNKLGKIHSELESNKEQLKKLNGFNEIYHSVNLFLKITPIYENLYYAIEKIKNKMESSLTI